MGVCGSKPREVTVEASGPKSAMKKPKPEVKALSAVDVEKSTSRVSWDVAPGSRNTAESTESEGPPAPDTSSYELRLKPPGASFSRANSDPKGLRLSGRSDSSDVAASPPIVPERAAARAAARSIDGGLQRAKSMAIGVSASPQGKNQLQWVEAGQLKRRRTGVERQRSMAAMATRRSMGAEPTSGASASAATRKWVTFEPVKIDAGLSASDRELARSRLKSALSTHFMFSSFSPERLEDAVGAMRHRIVRAKSVVTVQGDAASHFYVCTRGGFDMSVTAAGTADKAEKTVLVAQVGPAGSFGSGALLRDDAEVKVTSTAAVDSEVFALSRDAFQRLSRAGSSKIPSSQAIEAMTGGADSTAPLSKLPRATLDAIALRMERFVVPASAELSASAPPSDDFMLILAEGSATLAPTAAALDGGGKRAGSAGGGGSGAEGGTELRTSALLARVSPEVDGGPITLAAGDVVACGGSADELLLASLYSTHATGGGGKLHLLRGAQEQWKVSASDEAILFRVPLKVIGAALQSSPALVGGTPIGVRALLQAQPCFRELKAAELDQLSFAFTLTAVPPGKWIVFEGKPAARLHVILHGAVERSVTQKQTAFYRLKSFRKTTSTLGSRASTKGSMKDLSKLSAKEAKETAQVAGRAVAASCTAGDVLGATSVLGANKKERATATAICDSYTLSIDKAAALSLFPPQLTSAILSLPDAAKLLTSERMDINSLVWKHHIARGTFGSVGAFSPPGGGALLAVKKVMKCTIEHPPLRRQAMAERAALASFNHTCIAKLLATHKNALALYYVLELCDGPELYAVLQEHAPLPEETIKLYSACIAAGLGALHAQRWVYRDVKAENIMLTSGGRIKIVDFGLAKRLPPAGRCFTVCGSTEYMAPEVVGQASGYDTSADWWSVGCLTYEMAFGFTPWLVGDDGQPDLNMSDTKLSRNIIDKKRAVILPADAPKPSKPLLSFVQRLLTRPPTERLGGGRAGLAEVTGHAFLSSTPWEQLEAGTMPMPPMPKVSKPAGGDGASLDDVGLEEDEIAASDDDEMDPVSAQLMAYIKQKQSSDGISAEPTPPTPLTKGKSSKGSVPKLGMGWGWASSASMCSVDDEEEESGEGFFDGPAWEPEDGGWDRDF